MMGRSSTLAPILGIFSLLLAKRLPEKSDFPPSNQSDNRGTTDIVTLQPGDQPRTTPRLLFFGPAALLDALTYCEPIFAN